MIDQERWEIFWCYDFWDVLYDRSDWQVSVSLWLGVYPDIGYGYGLHDRFTLKLSFAQRLQVKLPEWCILKRVNASQPLHEQVPCPSTLAAQHP